MILRALNLRQGAQLERRLLATHSSFRRVVRIRPKRKSVVDVCVPVVSTGEMGMCIGLDKKVGTVAEILDPGTEVEEFETVAWIDSDKATLEVRTPFSGIVGKALLRIGDEAHEGEPVVEILKIAKPGGNARNESCFRVA